MMIQTHQTQELEQFHIMIWVLMSIKVVNVFATKVKMMPLTSVPCNQQEEKQEEHSTRKTIINNLS